LNYRKEWKGIPFFSVFPQLGHVLKISSSAGFHYLLKKATGQLLKIQASELKLIANVLI
jgi:hypothetical protein